MIDILDKKVLESRFAEDFASPYFPLLADMYLLEGDLSRAHRVCEVGLDHDSGNIDGKFVFAKVAMAKEKFTVAEKWLKQVVDENPAHFNGLRMLIKLEFHLKRSPKTIRKYINRILRFLPDDTECKELLDNLQPHNTEHRLVENKNFDPKPESAKTKIVSSEQKSNTDVRKTYNIEESMATFTMVQILKSQQHYNQALTVLEMLESMGQDSTKIASERDDVLHRISESQT